MAGVWVIFAVLQTVPLNSLLLKKKHIEIATQWLSRFTLYPSFLPGCQANTETMRGKGQSRKKEGRGVSTERLSDCSLLPYKPIPCRCHQPTPWVAEPDTSSSALMSSLSQESWGIAEEVGFQGVWEQQGITAQLHHPRGQPRHASHASCDRSQNDRSQGPNSQNPAPSPGSASL